MAIFLCNGGLELILGSIAITFITIKAAFEDKRPKHVTGIK